MRRPRNYCAIAVLLLVGCSMAPDHVRPAMPVPDAWALPDHGVTDAARPARWQQFFRSPALVGTIETALDNNRDLRVAIQRVELARSQYRIKRADLFPQVNVGTDLTRTRTPADLSYTGKTAIANNFSAEVSASWEVDLWGRVRNLNAAALESWLSTDEARRAVALNLIAEVANTWLAGRELDERIALAERTIGSRRESARIARRRYEVGAAPRLDLTQAEALLGQAESALITLEQRREQNRNALALLVGAPVGVEVVALSSVEDAVVRDLPAGLPSDLLTERPDIRGAENRLRVAEANIGAARAAFFPRIALTGDYGTASEALDGLFAPGSGTWTIASSVAAPLFDGGRLRGNLASAKAEQASAVADYERTVQTAFRDVADALAARRWLGQQVEAERRTLKALGARAHLSDLRYLNGAANYLEVLDAQRDLFATEQALVETERARLSSEVNLYAALGGGRDDPSRSTEVAPQETNGRMQ
ncbi:efflux transporter outer membrane subunit [Telmatospirillum sp.]|uniref:efflux transporter outer membrane subunit n=1 Tax=Telmatospirillum sp. TaxID=2079197 RepID=UPI0028489B4D|nr:efflux transporter outer membrane subunit [Telmatospirillum sp.]MDR3436730.1 efflux transporter outer membrane subunit [Telmatospirillum sp.]